MSKEPTNTTPTVATKPPAPTGVPIELSIHMDELRYSYQLTEGIVSKDGKEQMHAAGKLGDILQLASGNVMIGDNVIPDIFLDAEIDLYKYMDGKIVPGCRFTSATDWRPVPGDDHTLSRREQEIYIRRVIVPALAAMTVKQLEDNFKLPSAILPATLRTFKGLCYQALSLSLGDSKREEWMQRCQKL